MSDMDLDSAMDLLRALVDSNAKGNTEADMNRVEQMRRAFDCVTATAMQAERFENAAIRAENREREMTLRAGKAEQEAKEAHGRKHLAEDYTSQLRAFAEALQNALRFAEGFIASDAARYEAYRGAAAQPMRSKPERDFARNDALDHAVFRGRP